MFVEFFLLCISDILSYKLSSRIECIPYDISTILHNENYIQNMVSVKLYHM
jgi:hypothetical protein